ncbi:hypothetical protein Tco_0987188, partial [Tanacetum coccineum]
LIFLASLGHSGDIRKITDVNVNKLHQPWRSFAAIINKCLSGIPSYDSLRLSQAQILWGMYNKKNVDYAYLLWEDFIFKIENKNTKKGNAMYYPRFTKFNTTAGNPVKKILLKLNLSDHRLFKDGGGDFRYSDTAHLSRSDKVLKLKNFKKDATLKLSKSTNQERYEHVGPEVASSQNGKVTRWRRDCAWLMISRCSRSQCQIQVQGTSSIIKAMITTTYSQEKVKSKS